MFLSGMNFPTAAGWTAYVHISELKDLADRLEIEGGDNERRALSVALSRRFCQSGQIGGHAAGLQQRHGNLCRVVP
jgi:hypothetical protein